MLRILIYQNDDELSAPAKVWERNEMAQIVYVGEIVTSVMKEDGKKKIETVCKGFPTKEEAIKFVDTYPESETVKVKIGKVWNLVPVVA